MTLISQKRWLWLMLLFAIVFLVGCGPSNEWISEAHDQRAVKLFISQDGNKLVYGGIENEELFEHAKMGIIFKNIESAQVCALVNSYKREHQPVLNDENLDCVTAAENQEQIIIAEDAARDLLWPEFATRFRVRNLRVNEARCRLPTDCNPNFMCREGTCVAAQLNEPPRGPGAACQQGLGECGGGLICDGGRCVVMPAPPRP